jgi:purine-binding chemotaxis protein CheW
VSAHDPRAATPAALHAGLDEVEAMLTGAVDPGERARVLAERARAVARPREEPRTAGVQVVAFRLGGERYAVEVGAVFQVVEAAGLSPLPATPPWVLGAVVARTRVVPVLDLRALLGLEGGGMSDLSKIVVLEHEGELFGIAVEDVEGRVDLERETLATPSDGPFVWIAPDRLALLDLSRVGASAGRGG